MVTGFIGLSCLKRVLFCTWLLFMRLITFFYLESPGEKNPIIFLRQVDRHYTRPRNSDHPKTLGSHPLICKYYLTRKQSPCRCIEIKDVEMGGYFGLSEWASNSSTIILIKEAEGDLTRKQEEKAVYPLTERQERCHPQQVDVGSHRSQYGWPEP